MDTPDFGYDSTSNDTSVNVDTAINNTDTTNLDTGKLENNGATDLESQKTHPVEENGNDDSNKSNLTEGTTIDADGITYTIDKDGNAVDSNGNIFKQANEVQAWIDSFDKVDDNANDITIDNIINAIGVDITDENNNAIEFDNSIEGIKSYVNAVIESARNDNYETALNTLYQKYPILNDVLNYYIANGNSLDGFNEFRDLSNVTLDQNNEAQLESIIQQAWAERGQNGDVNNYIAYLKSSGTLYATAKDELEGLIEHDRQYREQLEQEAINIENEKNQQLMDYWYGVKEIIDNRKIAGYQIPDSIIINRNGQKYSVTPNDFFNYIYQTDKDGKSAYERDLMNESFESRRDDELLRAYLKFVGGNYSNLVDMAINEQQVNRLKLRAKERNNTAIRITRPTAANKNADIDLGYN